MFTPAQPIYIKRVGNDPDDRKSGESGNRWIATFADGSPLDAATDVLAGRFLNRLNDRTFNYIPSEYVLPKLAREILELEPIAVSYNGFEYDKQSKHFVIVPNPNPTPLWDWSKK